MHREKREEERGKAPSRPQNSHTKDVQQERNRQGYDTVFSPKFTLRPGQVIIDQTARQYLTWVNKGNPEGQN